MEVGFKERMSTDDMASPPASAVEVEFKAFDRVGASAGILRPTNDAMIVGGAGPVCIPFRLEKVKGEPQEFVWVNLTALPYVDARGDWARDIYVFMFYTALRCLKRVHAWVVSHRVRRGSPQKNELQ